MAFRLLGRRLMACGAPRVLCSQRTTLSPALRVSATASPLATLSSAPKLGTANWERRSFAVSAVSAQSTEQEFVQAIETELKYERENNQTTTADVDPPGDWIKTETPGTSVITLTRRHEGEEILVEFSVDAQSPGGEAAAAEGQLAGELEEEDNLAQDPQVDLAITFDATVIKGDRALTFDLTSDGTYVEINHVSVGSSKGGQDPDEYDGPVFSELDNRLQLAFQKYLEDRAIDGALGEYLLAVADPKEQSEYVRWLGSVKTFLDTKA